MNLALNNLQRLICHKTQPTNKPDAGVQSMDLWVVCTTSSQIAELTVIVK